ncbi:hypothetical protein GPA26_23405 [Aromatoleum petrolei]|uniref:Methyl-accepting transducer domain-containing protein n=1 Tax=Aromatoleum petrolei TaxID=76116 RepID=A0ABX1MTV9_9RHOO|nr:hypothetical protein [Aromatoleum petrolei]QTQ34603.1 Methyl-accepting chemotaxis domain-containing protein [Aromatoleum petrolei]
MVADEVLKLAERTATSTKSINSTADAVRADTDAALGAMRLVVEDVLAGSASLEQTELRLAEIVAVARQSAGLAVQEREALGQQTEASNQIAGTMERISCGLDASQQAVAKIRDAGAELCDTALELEHLTAHLRVAGK